MTCDQAIELLPWLLNRTLEDDERREVLAHLGSCAHCRAALAETRTAWQIFDWHPEAAALVAYAGGRPEGTAAAAEIEAHLAGCPRCAAELELIETSRLLAGDEGQRVAILWPPGQRAPATARPGPGEQAAASRAWRRSALAAGLVGILALSGWLESARQTRSLEQRLAASGGRGAGAPAPAPTANPAGGAPRGAQAPPSATPDAAQAELRRRADEAQAKLAALAGENRELQQRVADLGRTATRLSEHSAQLAGPPQPRVESGVAVEELSPAEQVQRGDEAPAQTVVPLSTGSATLLLHTRTVAKPGHDGGDSAYEIEIHDAQGGAVAGPLRVLPRPGGGGDSFAEFDVILRRGALPPGRYVLALFGRSGGHREPLATYPIRVS